jgi:hypothetical protein
MNRAAARAVRVVVAVAAEKAKVEEAAKVGKAASPHKLAPSSHVGIRLNLTHDALS